MAVIGDDGLVGVSVILGGDELPGRAEVLIGGYALEMGADPRATTFAEADLSSASFSGIRRHCWRRSHRRAFARDFIPSSSVSLDACC